MPSYRVADASSYVVVTGGGVKDVKIVKKVDILKLANVIVWAMLTLCDRHGFFRGKDATSSRSAHSISRSLCRR